MVTVKLINNMASNGNVAILHALRASSKTLSLDNSNLTSLPSALSRLKCLKSLSAKNNNLQDDISDMLSNFTEMITINLGGNSLTALPPSLSSLLELSSLHLFNNNITHLNDIVLEKLEELVILNLNRNLLQEIPSTIIHLQKLKVLNIADNSLNILPRELCHLSNLCELHLEGNNINKLPMEIGKLKRLKKLYLQKNRISHIPPSIGECKNLQTLDVSCNRIQIFPAEICQLRVQEFYFEHNPFLPPIPVPSEQLEEILPLKELTSRYLIKELENDTRLEAVVQATPELKYSLSRVGICAICDGPFINSWLDCVQFVSSKKIFPVKNHSGLIPLRVVLCSYSCFNKDGHDYYGIAIPPEK